METTKGAPYPEGTDAANVPGDIQSLAEWIDEVLGNAMTTAQRNALAGADLWADRIIYNLTTGQLERYNLPTTAWVAVDLANHLLLSGGALTGVLAMGNNKITGLGAPTATTDAATKGYADTLSMLQAFSAQGVLAVKVGVLRWRPPFAITLLGVSAAIGAAPVGADLILDINKNAVTTFTTQANRPRIVAGSNGTAAEVTTMDIASFNGTTDYLTVDADQVGSATPGSDLVVMLRFRRT